MKRKICSVIILGCLFAVVSQHALAQEKPVDPLMKIQAEAAFKIMAPKGGFGRVVKGAPYSATATTESLQTLSDGNQIIRKNESKLFRDAEGRTRIEQTLRTIGKWTAEGEAESVIFINDPEAGVGYSLNMQKKTAHKNNIGVGVKAKAELDETMRLKLMAAQKAEAQAKTATEPLAKIAPEPGQGNENKKTESLGKQALEGVEVEHTKITLTIPAGEIGNTLPIEVVEEVWYSPELQAVIMSKRRDPRAGETTYKLTNLSRSEPDRSLFEVPSDYNVIEPPSKPLINIKKKPAQEE